jgi:subtilisin family serine protease
VNFKYIFFLFFFLSCAQESPQNKKLNLAGSGQKVVLLLGVDNPSDLKNQASLYNIHVEGDVILQLRGDTQDLNQLEISAETLSLVDEKIDVSKEETFPIHQRAMYLAKKDFGLLEFWQNNPQADGRGVTVGVLDDGISPHQLAFRQTSTGERKVLKKSSYSTFSEVTLDAQTLTGEFDETQNAFVERLDLNQDGQFTKIIIARKEDKNCIDLNLDGEWKAGECQGDFSVTGNYFVTQNQLSSIVAEYDSQTQKIKISQPEIGSDSHGEGVATVMAGFHPLNESLNGVAPGAKILDWDISEVTNRSHEEDYTVGKIIAGLEWLGKNGADVANISYSLFFTSLETQLFMAKAFDQIVKKYNVVLTFSAGNNGPGLGSLNRKALYPDSVLVTGAYVSKELDEVVWGVTGLPEEGRVVFYSSRGPGALGDHGPTLISPLSSLTHGSATGGYQAFSGTSSAAPALGGLAAVLISALKAQKIPIDAATVVHALRLSGKRLKGEPFVAQGYGLPQIARAIDFYKKLAAGEQVLNLNFQLNTGKRGAPAPKGLVIYKSQNNSIESARVTLNGVLSSLAPAETRLNFLKTLRLEYSKGLYGPQNLWVSTSQSRFDLDVQVDEVLSASSQEGFAEIKFFDSISEDYLGSLAVTVINDLPAQSRIEKKLEVFSQSSARLHFHVSTPLKALRVRAKLLEGDAKNLGFSVFSPAKIRTQRIPFSDDFWIVLEGVGQYQLGLAMSGGTARRAVVEVEINPIELDLMTSVTSAAKSFLKIENLSHLSFFSQLEVRPIPLVLQKVLSKRSQKIEALEHKLVVNKPESLSAKIAPIEESESRFFYAHCTSMIKDKNGVTTFGGASFIQNDNEEREVNFRCVPFDLGLEVRLPDFLPQYVMQIEKLSSPMGLKSIGLPPSSTAKVDLSSLETGKYEVFLLHPVLDQADQRFRLGEFEAL